MWWVLPLPPSSKGKVLPSRKWPSALGVSLLEDRHHRSSPERGAIRAPREGDLVLHVEPDFLLGRGQRTCGFRSLSSQYCNQSPHTSSFWSCYLMTTLGPTPSISPNRTWYSCHQGLFHPEWWTLIKREHVQDPGHSWCSQSRKPTLQSVKLISCVLESVVPLLDFFFNFSHWIEFPYFLQT